MQRAQWLKENSFHHSHFQDLQQLLEKKRAQGVEISLCIPTCNEEETIGSILTCYQRHLMEEVPVVDEILVIDARSRDKTTDIVTSLGIPCYFDDHPLEEGMERITGKGEALWKSLYFAKGDIILWSDSDIKNPHPRFVYGILGPLLHETEISFVKAFYRRPLKVKGSLQQGEGGRVTELVVKPLLNLFYQELGIIFQPLSGEYGGRREILEKIPFSTGYGVESGLLLDIYERWGLQAIAQVDLEERIHHNQDLKSLKKMSFGILQRFIYKLEEHGYLTINKGLNKTLTHAVGEGVDLENIEELERPPMEEIPLYQKKFL